MMRMRCISCLAAAAIWGIASAAAQVQDSLSAAWAICIPPRMQGHIEAPSKASAVVEACTKVIAAVQQDRSRLSLAFTHRGVAHGALQQLPKAVADFSDAIRLDPLNAEARFQRATALLDLGKDEESVADYTALFRLDPTDAEAWNNRGVAYARLEQLDRAIADWTRAIAIKPHYAEAYSSRGYTYFLSGSQEKALADLNEAVRWRPRYPVALAHRGLVLERLNKQTQAKEDYEAVLRAQPVTGSPDFRARAR